MTPVDTAMDTESLNATDTPAHSDATPDKSGGADSLASVAQLGKLAGDKSTPDSGKADLGDKAPARPVPFAAGKEKFLINGEEHEWDWETTKKYAQIGRSGHQAMEAKAKLEKTVKETWSNLQTASKARPVALLETISGMGRAELKQLILQELGESPASGAAPSGQSGKAAVSGEDPRIEALTREVNQLKGDAESRAIEAERQALNKELEDAVKKYPDLDTPEARHYVKSQYARYLEEEVPGVTLEDVAFHVSQQIQERAKKAAQAKTQARAQAREQAPISSVPGERSAGRGMTREEVMRLAGRIS